MATSGMKPGTNTRDDGGIYREYGPRGGPKDNWATVPDNTRLPPTQKPGDTWVREERTPDSHH